MRCASPWVDKAGGPAGGDGVVSGGIEARGWIADVLARLENRDTIEPLPVPSAFEGELRPYQERGYAWLRFLRRWGLGACLADDMGLGKTVQTLALILHDREKPRRTERRSCWSARPR